VTINEVQKPREAQLDDEFAQSLGLEAIEQLRGLLRGSSSRRITASPART
jgi:trigger factor